MKPILNDMIRFERQEAMRVCCFLDRDDISDSALWHGPNVPTFYNAVVFLEPQFGIVPAGERVSSSQGGYMATVTTKCGKLTHIGAASSKDQSVATCLAYRNAIRQLIPQQSGLVWGDKHKKG